MAHILHLCVVTIPIKMAINIILLILEMNNSGMNAVPLFIKSSIKVDMASSYFSLNSLSRTSVISGPPIALFVSTSILTLEAKTFT